MPLADARQRIADEHVDEARATVGRRDENGGRRLLADFADDSRFPASGGGTQGFERRIGLIGGYHGEKLTFVRNVERIEAQKLASRGQAR
jgi:hypothetical protein